MHPWCHLCRGPGLFWCRDLPDLLPVRGARGLVGSLPFDFRAPGCRYNEMLNNYHVLDCWVESGEVTDADDD